MTHPSKLPRTQRAKDADIIRKKLKYQTYDMVVKHWLDTGSRRLNKVLGSEKKGLAYGKIIEISGPNHGGKTLIAEMLTGLAQEDGATACKIDLEGSHDDEWSKLQGVDTDSLYLIQPKMGKFHKKDTHIRLQGAEEMFDEAEAWMALQHERDPKGKMIVVVDSIGMLKTRLQNQAGATGQNMRTSTDGAIFFAQHLPRWVGLALNYNALIIFINQIRHNPSQRFGDPEYAPGGNSKDHACSVRVKVRRIRKGQIKQMGKVIGIIGLMRNVKNKSGGGSREGAECGFKYRFGKDWTFMSRAKAEKLIKGDAA
jgi:RecA/RadA recombinase